ncbi:lipopolysaccharide biosynthesis protein (plasmid) [Haloferax mediterranei ATCC 33500]|uniref:Export protein n=1 Tax=Haloferax mediterranei (strain ATCC 33500 / DSM 1411 / JCM 8866 / NBRC 14739 / NCIMB 2177 / R-4) TaxID=523841 RepID=I3RAT1_HALMT|nr:lipopolysaccharide biosynthesis protein [Haloferax mediterranei]AFK21341.1 export protein [Haloferax mediterranei ATCC 33500]AHZ24575.1 transporter [Haloferax mediterranei ATCC 33500]ELZ97332.1 export protein [Haloferax mediterranei ATCC 33500]MDX5990371.1 lipopolysaccharide biosynthesis protein [Haloferax mediterranei ATCC 33500]QCQ76969.1 lipopolysaccharide biosynthesis protein [Haloferax mediterranei ATCC 33500]
MIDTLRSIIRAIKRRFVPGEGDLTERTVKSGMWVSAMNVLDRVLKVVMFIVLARLLGPEAIGLMGIALLTISALLSLTNLGIDAALIQRIDDDVDEYLNTMFSLEILRGLLMSSILYLAAPALASLFGEPAARDLIRAIALVPIFLSLRNPAMVYFKKDLEFHKEFTYRVSGTMAYVVVALGYAAISPTVWALIFGYLADAGVRALATYLLHPYRPWPSLNREYAAELIGYGKWVTGSSIVEFLYGQGDDAIVGWLLTATSLGYYQLAYRISNAPATEIAVVVSSVMFSTYSKLQEEQHALREAFFSTFRLTAFVALPMSVGIFLVAPSFVGAFLGSDWLPMVATMQILVAYGLFRTLFATFNPVWRAVGRPDVQTKLGTLRVVLLAIIVVPMTSTFGIEGTALAVTGILAFPMIPLYAREMKKTLGTTYTRFLREISYPTLATVVMALAVLAVQSQARAPLVEFGLLVATGVVAYVISAASLMALFDWRVKQNLQELVSVMSK